VEVATIQSPGWPSGTMSLVKKWKLHQPPKIKEIPSPGQANVVVDRWGRRPNLVHLDSGEEFSRNQDQQAVTKHRRTQGQDAERKGQDIPCIAKEHSEDVPTCMPRSETPATKAWMKPQVSWTTPPKRYKDRSSFEAKYFGEPMNKRSLTMVCCDACRLAKLNLKVATMPPPSPEKDEDVTANTWRLLPNGSRKSLHRARWARLPKSVSRLPSQVKVPNYLGFLRRVFATLWKPTRVQKGDEIFASRNNLPSQPHMDSSAAGSSVKELQYIIQEKKCQRSVREKNDRVPYGERNQPDSVWGKTTVSVPCSGRNQVRSVPWTIQPRYSLKPRDTSRQAIKLEGDKKPYPIGQKGILDRTIFVRG
jgi:hypothetical protein